HVAVGFGLDVVLQSETAAGKKTAAVTAAMGHVVGSFQTFHARLGQLFVGADLEIMIRRAFHREVIAGEILQRVQPGFLRKAVLGGNVLLVEILRCVVIVIGERDPVGVVLQFALPLEHAGVGGHVGADI